MAQSPPPPPPPPPPHRLPESNATPPADLLPAGSLGLSLAAPSAPAPAPRPTTADSDGAMSPSPAPASLDAAGLPALGSRLTGPNFPQWHALMEEYLLLSDLWAAAQGTDAEPYAPSDARWARTVRAGLVEPALPAAEPLPRGTSSDTRVRNELLLLGQREAWLAWRRREHAAQGAILRAVAPEIKDRLRAYSHASDMWAYLVATYSSPAA
ncbi:hypothetical protein Q8F55_004332 [Vanrija albida]|uniref:DUF4219 domain-containing protein n=1 Tax=Vanrija albida TaxID=181172 RepID=A0ABR3Q6G6_9TREE